MPYSFHTNSKKSTMAPFRPLLLMARFGPALTYGSIVTSALRNTS
jgi:hypothetical protein